MQPRTREAGQEFASEFFVPSTSPTSVQFAAASHIGLTRNSNEDHFAVFHRIRAQEVLLASFSHDETPPGANEAYCFVVADGLGGALAGETASRVAIQKVFDLADQASSWVMRLHNLEAQQVQKRVDAYVNEMHSTLRAMGEADADLAGMGTTWTSAYVIGWDALVTQIGDSRAYLARSGELRQITRDQTLAQVLIDRGVPADKTGNATNILTNALGGQADSVTSETAHLVFEDGDRLLLCTDGLTRYVSDAEIAEVLGHSLDLKAACNELVDLALNHGGKDNVTVMLAEFSRLCK